MAEVEALRERALTMLAAFDREETGPAWSQFRELVQKSTRIGELRTILRELRDITGTMSRSGRKELDRALAARFGDDIEGQRELEIVTRGRTRAEREYRSVQAYIDSKAGDQIRDEEFLAFGALLDAYSAAPYEQPGS